MNESKILEFSSKYKKELVPIKVGQRVKVHQKVIEGNKERVQVFDGLVIKKRGGNSTNGSFGVRKISEGVGVEKYFPIHSPNIIKIEIIRQHKVRRSKLYFMRERFGKSARLKEDKSFDLEKEQELLRKKEEASSNAVKKDEKVIESAESKLEKTDKQEAKKSEVENVKEEKATTAETEKKKIEKES